MSLEPDITQKSEEKITLPPPKKTPTVVENPVVVPPTSPLPKVIRKPSKDELSKDVGEDGQKQVKFKKPGDASDDSFKNPNEQLPIDDSFGKVLRGAKGAPLVANIGGQRYEQKAALQKEAMTKTLRREQVTQPSSVPSEPRIAQVPQMPVQPQQNAGQSQLLVFFDPNTKQYYTVLQQPPNQAGVPPMLISGMNAPIQQQGRFMPQSGQSVTYQQPPMTNQSNQMPGLYPSAHALSQQVHPQSQAYPPAQRATSVPKFSAVVLSNKKKPKKRKGEDQSVKSGKPPSGSGHSKQSAMKS